MMRHVICVLLEFWYADDSHFLERMEFCGAVCREAFVLNSFLDTVEDPRQIAGSAMIVTGRFCNLGNQEPAISTD